MSLEGLNPQQAEAVLHHDGPLVVFAGAGSGKTRVITHRIANLVLEHSVAPWKILAVTFTNKAAQEMRHRLRKLLPATGNDDEPASRKLWVGTFHAICARLLRRYHEEIGVKRAFTIYDDSDQKSLVVRVLRDLKLDEKRYPAKGVAAQINRAKQEVVGPDEMDTAGNPWLETVREIYGEYERRLRQSGALDFGDLIYRMVRALENDADLRDAISKRFEHILVDEFQDTNHAQYRLLRALTEGHRNLCVVGDDDQSIYRWRGADRRNILDFRKAFPDATLIKLEQNYRSTQRILRASHAVISRNLDREPKELWTENEDGLPVAVIRNEDERAEAAMVVRKVRSALDEGRSLEEIALFYRTHAQSRVLEEALRHANIPYRVVGGTRFYDRAEVKDLLAYLRVIHNPDDDVSLLRIINTPARGIGKTTLERLLDHAAAQGQGVNHALATVEEVDSIGASAKSKLVSFRELQDGFRSLSETASLSELTEAVIEQTGYVRLLEQQGTVEADSRIANIQELVGSIEEFEEAAEEPSLEAFLELVTLQTQADEATGDELLTLMTVHAAKGLEFPVVIVAGLEEGLFPLRGGEAFEDPEELEEERRLAYVAFTRAKEELGLSYANVRRIYGQLKIQRPSAFLFDLPEDAVRMEGAPAGRDVMDGRVGAQGSSPSPTLAWSTQKREESSPASAVTGDSYVDRSEFADFDGGAIHIGMRVRHQKFGNGTVQSLPAGVPPRMRVRFPGWGEKTVVASYLEPA